MIQLLILAMFAQVLLTFSVMIIMGRRRFAAAKAKLITAENLSTMSLENAPEKVQLAGRNFENQFEMPVLFYVVSLAALALNTVSPAFVALAWAYVLLRVVHSIIHLGKNTMLLRFRSFLLSSLVLLVMWAYLVIHIFLTNL